MKLVKYQLCAGHSDKGFTCMWMMTFRDDPLPELKLKLCCLK